MLRGDHGNQAFGAQPEYLGRRIHAQPARPARVQGVADLAEKHRLHHGYGSRGHRPLAGNHGQDPVSVPAQQRQLVLQAGLQEAAILQREDQELRRCRTADVHRGIRFGNPPDAARGAEQLHHAQEGHQDRRERDIRRHAARGPVLHQHDQAHARNRLLQPLRAHDGPHRRDGVQETELERQRNGAARHIALQRIRYGEQGTRDIRRRPHFLDQRTDEQMRRDQFRAARTATHTDRDRCEEARIPVP